MANDLTVQQIDETIRIRTEEKSRILRRIKDVRGWQVYDQNQDRVVEINKEIEKLKAQREIAVGRSLKRAFV